MKIKKTRIRPLTGLMIKPDKDGKYIVDSGTAKALINFGLAEKWHKKK